MAKNQNTFAKRQREMDKKAKAEAKRERRLNRKKGSLTPSIADQMSDSHSLDDRDETLPVSSNSARVSATLNTTETR